MKKRKRRGKEETGRLGMYKKGSIERCVEKVWTARFG